MDKKLGISLGMSIDQVEKAINENKNAVAILVNNPTYYGVCSDIKKIVKMAHDNNMMVLAEMKHMGPIFILEKIFQFLQ